MIILSKKNFQIETKDW